MLCEALSGDLPRRKQKQYAMDAGWLGMQKGGSPSRFTRWPYTVASCEPVGWMNVKLLVVLCLTVRGSAQIAAGTDLPKGVVASGWRIRQPGLGEAQLGQSGVPLQSPPPERRRSGPGRILLTILQQWYYVCLVCFLSCRGAAGQSSCQPAHQR